MTTAVVLALLVVLLLVAAYHLARAGRHAFSVTGLSYTTGALTLTTVQPVPQQLVGHDATLTIDEKRPLGLAPLGALQFVVSSVSPRPGGVAGNQVSLAVAPGTPPWRGVAGVSASRFAAGIVTATLHVA
jgi:hypothetical protein